MLSLKGLLVNWDKMVRCTSRRTLLPEEDGPTTAQVSASFIRHVNSLKYGMTVSPNGYTAVFSKVTKGAPRVGFFASAQNWRPGSLILRIAMAKRP